MTPAPFTVLEPVGEETPVIVEVPHAGLHVPPERAMWLLAPARAIARDADLLVDELYADAPACGATMIVAHVSRYVIDLNRGENDTDSESVQGGASVSTGARMPRGLIWRLTTDNERALAGPLPRAEVQARKEGIYRPYHRALKEAVERKKARFGIAVILPGHSMPSVGRSAHGDSGAARADLVPGSRGRTSAEGRFIDLVEAHGLAAGLAVVHDNPYRGGFVTQHYGRPADGVHCVQVELARRLYLDEATLQRDEARFATTKAWCRELVSKLGRQALG
jgi:N-formylglutamate amidohydrolase